MVDKGWVPRFLLANCLAMLSLIPLFCPSVLEAQTSVLRGGEGISESVAIRFVTENYLADKKPRGYALGEPVVSRSSRANVGHYAFHPTLDGLPLLNGELVVHINRTGRVIRSSRGQRPREPKSRHFAIPASSAALLAAKSTGTVSAVAAPPEPVYFATPQETMTCWRIYTEDPREGAFEVIISATTGETLRVTSLTNDGPSSGAVFQAPDVAHPLKGGRTVEPLSGWPFGEGNCPIELYPEGAFGECWTNGTATTGNNADVCLDLNSDNVCDRRALGEGGSFSSFFLDSYSQTGNPEPDRDAAMINVFYWVNALHDWLYRLGFDEASGNFQSNNFSRGGIAGDSLRVDVQDGALSNSTNFSTLPDGMPARMQLGLFSWSLRDSAFDGDIIVHEYGHGVTSRLVGGAANVSALSLWQSGALAEGWSDALAATFTNDPIIGEYVANNPTSGIRSTALDANSYTFGRLGSLAGAAHGPTGRILPLPQVHADGEIWAATLWDVWALLGKEDFEQSLIDALKLTPARPSLLDARDAFIQATELLEVGGPNACAVWEVFAARGLGELAALNPIEEGLPQDTALSVFESFDLPSACGGADAPALVNLLNQDEDDDAGWSASGLWHRTTRKVSTGGYAWWFGNEETGTYDVGERTVGDLISPPIRLNGTTQAVLSWNQYFRGEGFNSRINLGGSSAPFLNADSGRVWISTDDGSSWFLATHIAHDSPGEGFVPFRINLARFAGSVIRVRFDFDTFNAERNNHEGWYIDNFRIEGTEAEQALLTVNPSLLSFALVQAAAASQPFQISFDGPSNNSWTATTNTPWLRMDQNSGNGPTTVMVSADAAGLTAGTYSGSVIIRSGSTQNELPALLTVSAPPAAVQWSFEKISPGPGAEQVRNFGPGVTGSGLRFDGFNDAVQISNSQLPASPSFTISAWVRLLRTPGKWGVLVANYQDFSGWYLGVLGDGRPFFGLALEPNKLPSVTGGTPLPVDSWVFISATYQNVSRTLSLYVDGELVDSRQTLGFTPRTTGTLVLGKASWIDSHYTAFDLDELSIVPYAQSAPAVGADYASFGEPSEPALALWRLDETGAGSATVLADSINGHNATTATNRNKPMTGVVNGARRFEGYPDSAAAAPHVDFESDSFTFSTWIRLDEPPDRWGVVFSTYDGVSAGWHLTIDDQRRPVLSVAGISGSSPWLTAGQSLTLGKWHHIAASFEGQDRRAIIYVDGVRSASAVFPYWAPSSGVAPRFGRASWANAAFLRCVLDEANLYGFELTASEVAAEYALGASRQNPLPSAYWKFEETASNLLPDSAGNHHAVAEGSSESIFANDRNTFAHRFFGAPDAARVEPHGSFAANAFTFSAWIRLDSLPSKWGMVFSNYDGNYRGWYAALNTDGRLIFSVSGLPASNPWLFSSVAITPGQWTHVAVTFDGVNRRGAIYLNGSLSSTAVFPAWTPQSSVGPTFARAAWDYRYYLDISIDEACFYEVELAAQEVTDLAANP